MIKTAALLIMGLISLSAFAKLSKPLNSNIRLSIKIPEEQAKLLESDLEYLNQFQFTEKAEPDTLEIMGLKELTSKSARKWLERRIKYIIPSQEASAKGNQLILLEDNYIFDNDDIQPELEFPKKNNEKPKKKGMVIMSNFGAMVYFIGKSTSQLLGLNIETRRHGTELVIGSSPRAGVMSIGPGLFTQRVDINNKDTQSDINKLARIAVFFHEARHSDGNSEHLSFFHALCPKGHDYANINACDKNLNGPYTIGALYTKEVAKNCTECNDYEREILKLRYLESKNRVLKTYLGKTDASNLKIENLKALATKAEKEKYMIKYFELLEEADELRGNKKYKTIVLSKHLDPTHEGERK